MTHLDHHRDDNAPATKGDLRAFATKSDLEAFATKEDLQAFATKDDLLAFATKRDLEAFATKEDLEAFATKEDLCELQEGILVEMDKRIEARAPATKTDVQMLMDEIGKLYIANERWKNDILDSMDEKLDMRFEKFGKQLVDQFAVIAENMYYDFTGAEKDKVTDHERRIVVLERRAGVRP